MLADLESVILSGLHSKAIAAGLDLNNKEQFLLFSDHVNQVRANAHRLVTQIVDNYSCTCGKNKTSVVKAVAKTGDKKEEHD